MSLRSRLPGAHLLRTGWQPGATKLLQRSSDLGSGWAEAGTISFLNLIIPDSPVSGFMRPRAGGEFIGQPVDYGSPIGDSRVHPAIDSLDLQRLDLLKIDIEGMEIEALAGARKIPLRAVSSSCLSRSSSRIAI